MVKLVEGYAARMTVPEGKRDIQVFDDALPGFGIRKFATGKAVFIVKYSVGGQQRKLSLGPVVTGMLAEKRRLASQILSRARLGHDPVGEKRASFANRAASLGILITAYLEERQKDLRPRYHVEVDRQLKRDWRQLHDVAVRAISRQEIVRIVDVISSRQGPVAADRARVALSGFFSWCIDRGHCDDNPTLHIKSRAGDRTRHRVLTASELVEIWNACRNDDHGLIVQLLILTGQRRQEIGSLTWDEIDFSGKQIELPRDRTKNGKPHLVPLCEKALAILSTSRRAEPRDYVFGRGRGGFSGWSKAKAELDARITAARLASGVRRAMPPWTLNDLRRSFITHVNEKGIAPPHVVEAIVNHISGHRAGVAGVYNKAQYLDERRQAMAAWGDHIANLLRKSSAAKPMS